MNGSRSHVLRSGRTGMPGAAPRGAVLPLVSERRKSEPVRHPSDAPEPSASFLVKSLNGSASS